MLLEGGGAEPAQEGRLGLKAGQLAGGRVEDDVDALAVGLTLDKVDGQVEKEMLALDMAQLVGEDGLTARVGEKGVDVDIKAAVVIREDDALDGQGQGDEADIVISHHFSAPR